MAKRELMNITGDIVIWNQHIKDEKKAPQFAAQISNKNQDDTWDNAFIQVDFKKEDRKNMKHGDYLRLEKAFLTFFRTKEDEAVFKIFVIESKLLGNMKEAREKKKAEEPKNELPF